MSPGKRSAKCLHLGIYAPKMLATPASLRFPPVRLFPNVLVIIYTPGNYDTFVQVFGFGFRNSTSVDKHSNTACTLQV